MNVRSLITGAPRPRPGPPLEVLQLAQGEKVEGVILSPKVWGFKTHWNLKAGNRGRSERCTADTGNCPGCENQLPGRWKGYLFLWRWEPRSLCFVELTPLSCTFIEESATMLDSLRGQTIRVKRGEGGKKCRLSVDLERYQGDHDVLPPDKDPSTVLETLWKWGR
jgi:hypothetical protein